MSPFAGKRGGRPAKTVRDDDGNLVPGLSAIQVKDRFRYTLTGSRPPIWFGFEKVEAIRRFHEFQAKKIRPKVPIRQRILAAGVDVGNDVDGMHEDEAATEALHIELDKNGWIDLSEVDEDVFAEAVRNWILKDPRNAAQKTGFKQIAWMDDVKKPVVAKVVKVTLDEILEKSKGKLTNKGKTISPESIKARESYWQQFADCVNVKYIDDITIEKIDAYGRFLHEKYADNTFRDRVAKIGTILNFVAKKIPEGKSKILELKALIDEHIDKPREVVAGPNPISKTDFHKLIDGASLRDRAIFITSLNVAVHAKEMGQILVSELDLKSDPKTFTTIRTKNGLPKSAQLWPETVAAIKAHLKTAPKHECLFLNNSGTPYKRGIVGTMLKSNLKRVGMTGKYTFDTFRDGFVKFSKNSIGKCIVLGNALEHNMDNYEPRTPDSAAVIAACEEVHQHYFGK